MQPRLERLEKMLGDPLFESILWGREYDLDRLDGGLRSRIESGQFKTIAFYGMGCSSVVSDIVKGFFLKEHIPIHVEVINDYDSDWFIDRQVIKHDSTLTIIVCYSGWSVEPCLFFESMRQITDNRNLIVLSAGGKIAALCKEHGTSLIQYKLRNADREYPLYHVQQLFAIFLDLFHKLRITKSSYQSDLRDSVKFLKAEFHEGTVRQAEAIAEKLRGSRIVLLSTADWYVTLLKQTTMFFNDIAMVPTHRNLLHEFSHSEVVAYSDPASKQAIVTFCDSNADDYTRNKIQTLQGLFGGKDVPQNRNIEFVNIDLDQDNFFNKFFFGHFFMLYVAYYLGKYANVEGRDLISIAAKNPWWSQRSIELFPKCIDIPSVLEPQTDTVRETVGLQVNGHIDIPSVLEPRTDSRDVREKVTTTSLSGKVALVTGSSRSIGAAIAKRLADDGANVVVNYVSNPQAASEVVDSINAKRAGAAIAVKADVSTVVGGQALLDETVKSFGKIDIIVLNAAIMSSKPLAEIDEQFFDDHMNLNVKGQLFLIKAAAPLLTSGARIIFLSSSLTKLSSVLPNALVYVATKGAIEQLSRVLAKDFGVRGITVNIVSPGPTDTDLFRQGKPESDIEHIASLSPLNRLGLPDDIAPIVSFLASPASGWINGQNIFVNGGYVV